MAHTNLKYDALFKSWDLNKKSPDDMILELRNLGLPDAEIHSIYDQYNKLKLHERHQKGMIMMILGGMIGLLSCVLTMVDLFPEIRSFTLYGLTSIGVLIAFIGAYFVFEK
jgi:hypothetical protein